MNRLMSTFRVVELDRLDKEQFVEAIAAATVMLMETVSCGRPTPFQAQLYKRMTAPRHGDLVVEKSAYEHWEVMKRENKKPSHYGTNIFDRVGRLVSVRNEQIPYPEPYQGVYTERIVYISRLDNHELQRWANCHFIAVPFVTLDSAMGYFCDHTEKLKQFEQQFGPVEPLSSTAAYRA